MSNVLVLHCLAEVEELPKRLGLLVVQPHVVLAKVIIDKLPSVVHKVAGASHDFTEPAEEIRLLLALNHLI